jgi:hypothetical protein
MTAIMKSGEPGSGHAGAASRRAARVAVPRVLILAATALVLTNMPLARYRSGGQPDFAWSSAGVLPALWQIWRHRRLAWGRFDCCHGRRTAPLRTIHRWSDQYRPARMMDPHHERSRHPGAGYLAQPAHPPLGR